MLHLEPHNDMEAAMRFFNRRRGLRWLMRLGLPHPRTISPKLPYAELVWLPYYLIALRVVTPKGPAVIDVSLDAYNGAFSIFEARKQLADEYLEEGDIFEPRMNIEEAVSYAKRRLLETVMFRRGQRGKPLPEEAESVDLFYYPFYVYYYERRRGKLDIRVFDAVRGENPGSKSKNSILSAMIAQRNNVE